VDDLLWVDAHVGPHRGGVPGLAAVAADGPFQPRRAEQREEPPVHPHAVDHALGAHVAVGQHRLGATLVDDLSQPGGDVVEGLVPAHPLELSGSLGARPAQRMQYPVRAVEPVLEVGVHLRAETTRGERVVGVAAQLDGSAVLDADPPRAGVRTVVPAGSTHNPVGHRHLTNMEAVRRQVKATQPSSRIL